MLHGCLICTLYVLPRASLVSGVRSHFPALVCGRRATCLSRAVPSRSHLFRSVQILISQSSSVERLSPLILLQPVYVPCSIAASLAPVSRRFLSLSSRRSPAPAACVPVLCRLRCLLVFPGPALVGSSLALAADQVGFRPSRRASSPFCLLGKGRPCHIGSMSS